MHRVALVVDPSPALLEPLVRGLAAAGYDVAFSAPTDAGPRLADSLARAGRRAFALDRSLDADVLMRAVRDELGRLDLVVVEPARVEVAPALATAEPGSRIGPHGPPALGAARAALELLGETGGSIVRLLHPTAASRDGSAEGADLEATRRLGRSLGTRVRVNGVAVPDAKGPGVATVHGGEDIVRAVLWLAGSNHLNGEVVSIDPGRGAAG